ncbi:MEDS domain-containing protein [Mucilaginibacter ginsenosidivorans]|uniref:histidine kinase n=1 Tax=Mucilaginibacter ginsenosidivorans TaxID=398053 RepID=A0A5B8USW8_9SPHI|nr:MEDS domain-containing protein [Mucilaginibacter ginsenosidivorans]QEC62094.1 PAS domain S-box protein [Mucilaginibacter ginsenosidivorans]
MKQALRPTGIEVLGNIPWGTHFCHFYQNDEDLLSIQVPFFKTGLENNEYCIWVTSGQTTVENAKNALKEVVPDLDKYYEHKSIEILSHHDWYLINGQFELDNVIRLMLARLKIALENGFAGLRLNGDEAWMDQRTSHDFMEYERFLNPAIAGKKLIISCSYQLSKCTATDVLDVALLHESAVSKRKDRWEILETRNFLTSQTQLNLERDLLTKRVLKTTRELNGITEQVKKERSERKKGVFSPYKSELYLKTIVNTSDIAFVLFDSDSHVLLFNAIANYWSILSFGVPLKKGVYLPDLLNEEGKIKFKETIKAVLSGQSLSYETSYQDQGEFREWYRVTIHPVKDDDGKVVGVCCTASNITRDKRAETELQRISGRLEERNKDVDKFAFSLSHDLRAPLANMLGLARMLKNTNVPNSERPELESFLFQSIEKLNDAVYNLNRILELDKTLSLKKAKVNLTELVNEVSARYKPIAKQDAVRIYTDFDNVNEIFTIVSYLESIFFHLIFSSITYNQTGRPPVIEITAEKTANKVIIHYKNFGKGGYSKGTKADAGSYKTLNTSIRGHGVGLSTVKTRVDILGGSISVGTLPDGGKEYRIELPLDLSETNL